MHDNSLKTKRDDFSTNIKNVLAQRVSCKCSNPDCCASTSGPQVNSSKAVNIGVAAHITAASPGGPRYDPQLTSEQRQHPDNGIWLCQSCSKLIDSDEPAYPIELLQGWKLQAEAQAKLGIVQPTQANSEQSLAVEEIELLIAGAKTDGLRIMSTWAGDFVTADGIREFLDQDDPDPYNPEFRERYLGALHSLVTKGLVRHHGGIFYPLTSKGHETARKLQLQNDT